MNKFMYGVSVGAFTATLFFIFKCKNEKRFCLLKMQELNHRIKNHLTLIIYMIRLYKKNEKELNALISLENKVFAISLIYNQMSISHDSSYVNAREHYSALIYNIIKCLDIKNKISYTLKCDNLVISSKKSAILAIIINELITNSYKHAFTKIYKHAIFISLTKKNNKFYFIYRDNGIGISKKSKDGIGISIINSFIDSLKADAKYSHTNGLELILVF